MSHSCEVVITGVGVVSPVGIGKHDYWHALLEGRSGVQRSPVLEAAHVPVPIAAELKDFEPKQFVAPRKSLKVMSREIQTGFAAGRLAIDDARLAPGVVDPDRLGIVFGCDMLYCHPPELTEAFRPCLVDGRFQWDQWGTQGMLRMYPLWLLMYLPNMAACHLAISFDARGPNNTITAGDASSLLAIIEAVQYLERGWVDVVLTGGTGTRLNATQLAYRSAANLSRRIGDPAAACRPFDADRDGMVNGEGAGAFVLETRAHAEARGATIHAVIRGWGQGFNAAAGGPYPDGRGIAHAIQQTLARAGWSADRLGHVNAHGVSTVEDDRSEATAIRRTLGATPVTALKSYFGNLGAGSGAVELAASVLAIEHGIVPRTLNYQRPDPACPIAVVRDEPLVNPHAARSAMAISFSSTGPVAALLIERP